jgi:hypothetical protein
MTHLAPRALPVAASHNSQKGTQPSKRVLHALRSERGRAKLDGVGAAATIVDIGLNHLGPELRGPEKGAVRRALVRGEYGQ